LPHSPVAAGGLTAGASFDLVFDAALGAAATGSASACRGCVACFRALAVWVAPSPADLLSLLAVVGGAVADDVAGFVVAAAFGASVAATAAGWAGVAVAVAAAGAAGGADARAGTGAAGGADARAGAGASVDAAAATAGVGSAPFAGAACSWRGALTGASCSFGL
jgi:hypothetical protein